MAIQNNKPVVMKSFSSKSASSFWYDFDTDFKRGDRENSLDLTKLAAVQRAIGNFVNIVTGKQIPVVFQSKDSSYTDGERVVIGTQLDNNHFDPAVGLALHEGSHIALTDFSIFKRSDGNTTSFIQDTIMADVARFQGCGDNLTGSQLNHIKGLLNWIEDRRIDYHIYTNAPGYRMYYEAMYNRYFNDKIIDKALIARQKKRETWDDYLFHIINFTNPNRQLDTLKQLKTIWTLIDLKHISRLQSTQDALLLSCEIFKIIDVAVKTANEKPKPAPKKPQQPQPESDDTDIDTDNVQAMDISDGSDSESDDTPDVPEPQDPTEESEDNDSEDETDDVNETAEDNDDDSEDEETDEEDADEEDDSDALSPNDLNKLKKALEKQADFIEGNLHKKGRLTKSQNVMVRALKESGTESRVVYTGPAGKSDPIDTVVIKKLTANVICSMSDLFCHSSADCINGKTDYKTSSYTRIIREHDEAVTKGIILGKQLGSKLQIRDSERTLKTTRLQSGKIDRRLVAQLGYENVNVFHKIVTDKFKKYFIHISIDASGSMSGTKFHNAITSAVAIAQAASMTTGIRVQISLRGTSSLSGNGNKCVTLYAYDSALDKMSKVRNLFKYLSVFGITPEGLAFKSIESDIKADARGDECIFINYSDGDPTSIDGCSRYTYNGVQFTKKVIDTYKSLGINIISYFIFQGYVSSSSKSNFKYMYGSDSMFIDPLNMSEVSKTVNRKFLEKAK